MKMDCAVGNTRYDAGRNEYDRKCARFFNGTLHPMSASDMHIWIDNRTGHNLMIKESNDRTIQKTFGCFDISVSDKTKFKREQGVDNDEVFPLPAYRWGGYRVGLFNNTETATINITDPNDDQRKLKWTFKTDGYRRLADTNIVSFNVSTPDVGGWESVTVQTAYRRGDNYGRDKGKWDPGPSGWGGPYVILVISNFALKNGLPHEKIWIKNGVLQ
jgi:hypothetical protein